MESSVVVPLALFTYNLAPNNGAEPIPALPVTLIPPDKSSLWAGEELPIPTFPSLATLNKVELLFFKLSIPPLPNCLISAAVPPEFLVQNRNPLSEVKSDTVVLPALRAA